MWKSLAVISLLLLSGSVLAQQNFPRDITVSWTNPDQYTDGTFIEAGDLESIRIEIFRNSDPVTPIYVTTVPDSGEGLPQSEVFALAVPGPGTYEIYGYAIVIGGEESDRSNPASKKYTGKPNKITSVTVP
jgi:hypothetical protein